LKWLAAIGLAVMVVCMACGTFFGIGLIIQGELTASLLGADWRVWTISSRAQSGLGLQRSYAVVSEGAACTHFEVTFLLWKPAIAIENVGYDNCG
jgi:hypothetical protein